MFRVLAPPRPHPPAPSGARHLAACAVVSKLDIRQTTSVPGGGHCEWCQTCAECTRPDEIVNRLRDGRFGVPLYVCSTCWAHRDTLEALLITAAQLPQGVA